MYSTVDIALLQSEHAATRFLVSGDGTYARACCPICKQLDDEPHAAGCEMDLALAERQFFTHAERETARKRLVTANALGPTVPPPPSETP